ncbi:2-oxoglutarate ferredoxin oxidoreductase subunit gamma [Thermotomaculum hydrothermale]|uniref:2-oxoglutarate ferredoxin oxidoreductase subunit gamma n=1 Tax=Thermotomaculum hydrothermale TaxID=981385 RepID=A0A7R6PL61_9BACT|nr:2-oxoacid:acceptor oxidoreductase family protein [Thermotomaculum hydrothermale]BBB32137.1 2-oxoglutarate ferredoxin oxidoreductase subunit gamma [Thermotomaculum hydrothermale]
MTEEIVFAGFGGQGVLSLGQIIAYSGMLEGKEVCWMPSYGPEMRGGTANCIVSVSDEPISSPILAKFDTAIVLNRPSFEKFEPKVKEGGILIYDSTTINIKSDRKDIKVIGIKAFDEAIKLKNNKVMGMILLGTYLKHKPIVKTDTVEKALEKVLPERHHHLIPLNIEAIKTGMNLA